MNQQGTDGAETGARLPEASERSYTGAQHEQEGAMTDAEADRRARRARPPRERLAWADRIQIAMFAGLVTMFAAMLGGGALAVTTLNGQLLDMQKQTGGQLLDMQKQIGDVQAEIGKLSERVGNLEERVGNLSERMGNLEERMGNLEERMGNLEERMGNLEERMTSVETLIQTQLVPQSAAPPPAGS